MGLFLLCGGFGFGFDFGFLVGWLVWDGLFFFLPACLLHNFSSHTHALILFKAKLNRKVIK